MVASFFSYVACSVGNDILAVLRLLWRIILAVNNATDILVEDIRILLIAQCAKHPEFLSKKRTKALAEKIVDAMEEDLVTICQENGLPYIRPELSDEGVELVLKSPMRFIKTFIKELRVACRSGCNFISI